MVVKLTEWDKNETGGVGIEITANKVVNLLLRSSNNLIKVNWDNEVYTDLQLEDWIATTDTLPVWVTTWRVLQADGWVKSWTMLCFKTTSWDQVTWIYGDDWKLYIDNGTWTFKQIYLKSEVDALFAQLRSELSTVAFTGDYSDLLNKPTLWTAAALDVWIDPWDIPQIQENWKLSSSILPAMAMHAYSVATKNDLVTLSDAVAWDLWFVVDENKTYILTAEPYSTLSNWKEYTAVSSVNWYRWVVNLTTNDIPVDWTTKMYVSSLEKNTWNNKLWYNDVATVAISWNYSDLNGKPTVDSAMSDSSTNAVQNNVIKAYVDTTAWSSAAAKVSDTAYWSSWDWVTWIAPSKNALYDKIHSVDSDISTIQWDISTISWDITTIQGDITTINWNITTMQWDIQALETAVAGGISDAAYSSAWDGDTTHAPSKNAVYDVLWDINSLLANI